MHEAFGASRIALVQSLLPGRCQFPVATGEHLIRRIAAQTTVVVFKVIPVEIALVPLTRVADAVKPSGVIRLILGGFELTLAEGVVVAHTGPTVAAGDTIPLAHQVQVSTGNHGSAPILVDNELARANSVALQRLVHQLLRQRTVFLARNHPGQHKAAEQIHNHIQRQVMPSLDRRQFCDVPGPSLVRCLGDDARHCMVLCRALSTTLALRTIDSEQPIHGADRAQVLAALEQSLVNLLRWLINKLVAVEKARDMSPLSIRKNLT